MTAQDGQRQQPDDDHDQAGSGQAGCPPTSMAGPDSPPPTAAAAPIPTSPHPSRRGRSRAELQADARLSYNELGRRVHLSPPAVAERVRRLERQGVITGYCADLDAAVVGYPITAFVQLRCSLGACLLKTSAAGDYPEVVEIHKLSGEHCSMLKLRATSLAHFEAVLEQLGKHGAMNTHIVLSTQFEDRAVQPPSDTAQTVTPSEGWTRGRVGSREDSRSAGGETGWFPRVDDVRRLPVALT